MTPVDVRRRSIYICLLLRTHWPTFIALQKTDMIRKPAPAVFDLDALRALQMFPYITAECKDARSVLLLTGRVDVRQLDVFSVTILWQVEFFEVAEYPLKRIGLVDHAR